MNFQTTPQEQKIFNLLLEVIKIKSPNTIIRAAGGIVRDRLLGLESNDLDIAVSDMSGQAFAQLVLDYMIENEIDNKGMSIIKSNPDQSKHLETAIINIFGLSIDFVNLRKETYSDSRIPTIEFGTPEEDAFRRDFTINALFYNINTDKIEDFTGNGLNDLQNKIIRTPIDPLQTFLDDPLRTLRGIRFSARFGFELSNKIIEAVKTPLVKEAFKNKISAERIWIELSKFMSSSNSYAAAKMLGELEIRDLIFKPSDEDCKNLGVEFSDWDSDQNSVHHNLSIWEHTLASLKYLNSHTDENDTEEQLVRNLSMLLHDFGKCDVCSRQLKEDGHFSYKGHEDSSAKLSEWALLKLKAPNSIIQRVKLLTAEHMRLHTLEDNASNKTLRKFIKDLGDDWRNSVDIAMADAMGKLGVSAEVLDKYINYKSRMEILEKEIQNGGGKTTIVRPINGYDLISLGIKPGPIMKDIFDLLDEELLEHPLMSKEEAIEFVKTRFI